MKVKTNLLSVLSMITMTLSGCGSSPTPQEQSAPKIIPAWISAPKYADDRYIYGIAVEANREDAIKAALVDMVAQLGTTIESSYESNQEVQGAYFKTNVKNQIKSNVAKIQVNNYEIVESYRVSYREFAVMLRTDKNKFVHGLIDSLHTNQKSILKELNSADKSNPLTKYNLKKELYKKSQSLLSDVMIIGELDKNFQKQNYLDFIANVKEAFLKEEKTLNFYLTGDKKSTKFLAAIKNILAKQGLNIANNQGKNSVVIHVKTTDTIAKNNAINIAVLTLNIDVLSGSQQIGGKTVILKERYNGSVESVYKNAAIHLEEDMKSHGINEAIGINLN